MNGTSSEPGDDRPATELGRVLARCHQRLRSAAPQGLSPLLRLQRGAGLIQGPRAQQILDLLEPLLALAASSLYVPAAQSMVAGATVRPKVRVALRVGGAGLLAECRYFGQAPADVDLRTLFTSDPANAARAASSACGYALAASNKDGIVLAAGDGTPALPASVSALAVRPDALARGEICLRAVANDPPRRWPVVRVMAGHREVAVPMFSVEQAVLEEQLVGDPPLTRSLAMCFAEESSSTTSKGRPALLVLRRGEPKVALRVEALIGHGHELVYPVSSLLQGTPWVLGVIESDDPGPPVLVVEPAALLAAVTKQ